MKYLILSFVLISSAAVAEQSLLASSSRKIKREETRDGAPLNGLPPPAPTVSEAEQVRIRMRLAQREASGALTDRDLEKAILKDDTSAMVYQGRNLDRFYAENASQDPPLPNCAADNIRKERVGIAQPVVTLPINAVLYSVNDPVQRQRGESYGAGAVPAVTKRDLLKGAESDPLLSFLYTLSVTCLPTSISIEQDLESQYIVYREGREAWR